MKIGHAIKVCRSAKCLSLNELSKLVDVSSPYLSMIESGKRSPTLSSIEKIAKALEVPMPILIFLASEDGELNGLDVDTVHRLSNAVINVMRA